MGQEVAGGDLFVEAIKIGVHEFTKLLDDHRAVGKADSDLVPTNIAGSEADRAKSCGAALATGMMTEVAGWLGLNAPAAWSRSCVAAG